ncbi:MAG: phosphoribosylamine--glycine ligase [Acidobacteria bacterium]|nr:phosphoribosylamine--glycine ligase [Acidobacteriota bacterium]
MRILLLGGGGREHALAWKLAQNPSLDRLWAAPGNAGIEDIAQCEPLDPIDPEAVAAFAEKQGIDLVVVGPEAPLVAGIADELASRGVPCFGPTAAAARIEGSKAWAKEIMFRAGVPTARSATFEEVAPALAYLESLGEPCVVKADGLAAGKGVRICETRSDAAEAVRDCLERGAFGPAGRPVVVEEFLDGEELSVFCLTDGRSVLPLAEARDHKRALDGDRGPNTGGMGAYSPVPGTSDVVKRAVREIFRPVVRTMDKEGARFVGLLYGGLMLTADGPKVLEFNCRFGDPETQAIIPRLRTDLAELLLASVEGNLRVYRPNWSPQACITVVLASGGYPGDYHTGLEISGLEAAATVEGVQVFHAGTARRDGRTVTAGGRVLAVSALGHDLAEARERAYDAAARIEFEGRHYRTDIAARAAEGG